MSRSELPTYIWDSKLVLIMKEWTCLPRLSPFEPIQEVSTVAKVNSLGSVPARILP
jgi:hypothetical protein